MVWLGTDGPFVILRTGAVVGLGARQRFKIMVGQSIGRDGDVPAFIVMLTEHSVAMDVVDKSSTG